MGCSSARLLVVSLWSTVILNGAVGLTDHRTVSCENLVMKFGYLESMFESGGFGTYRAVCNRGYRLNGPAIFNCDSVNATMLQCLDIDECAEAQATNIETVASGRDDYSFKKCSSFARCENTAGSYRCICQAGLIGDGVHCRKSTECPHPGNITNGWVEVSGRRAYYYCNPGFEVLGHETRTCTKGAWRHKEPFCGARYDVCPDPGPLKNGHRSPDMTVFPENTVLHFFCEDGYILVGAGKRRCTRSYRWTAVQPRCKKIQTLTDIAVDLRKNLIDKYSGFSDTNTLGRLAIEGAKGVDLVFLIDESSSVSPGNFQRGIDFIKMIVAEFGVKNGPEKENVGTRVALVTFGENSTVIFNLNDRRISNRGEFNRRVDKIKRKGGGTALHKALVQVWLKVLPIARRAAQMALFLLSDGENTIGNDSPSVPANNLRMEGFEIFSIGIGQGVDREELRSISSYPHSTHVFLLRNFKELEELNDIVIQRALDHSKCGISGEYEPDEKNTTAVKGAWPWLVRISSLWDICGGALICNNWILTAAKCLTGLTPADVTLELGSYHAIEESQDVQHVVAKRFHIHPAYDSATHANGVALIELDTAYSNTSATENKWVRSVCVTNSPGSLFESHGLQMGISSFRVGGWGVSHVSSKPSFLTLKSMNLRGVDRSVCKEWTDKLNVDLTMDMFCAGDRFLQFDACHGDTGGPLVYKRHDDRFVVVGVAIVTEHCHEKDQYGLYQGITSKGMAGWIHKTTGGCNLTKQPRTKY